MSEVSIRTVSIVLGFVILALDLLTKWWIQNASWLHDYSVIDGLFKIHYVQNEGIAFGLFHNSQSPWKVIILSAMAIVAVLVVLYYIWNTPSSQTLLLISLGLLLGGILGNFLERIVHRHVTDFIEVYWRDSFRWPTFNVADTAITCGVLFILYESFTGEELESSSP